MPRIGYVGIYGIEKGKEKRKVFNGCIVMHFVRRRMRAHWWVETACAELDEPASPTDGVQMNPAIQLAEVENKKSMMLPLAPKSSRRNSVMFLCGGKRKDSESANAGQAW